VKEIEPHVSCIAGIQVFTTGIVNYKQVCQKMADLILKAGSFISILKRKFARHLKLRCWKQTMAPLRLAL